MKRITHLLHLTILLTESFRYHNSAAQAGPVVVVIGGGVAGASATIAAYESGAKVILIDREGINMNSNLATNGINACQTSAQENNTLEDSIELFINDTMETGKYENDETLVRKMVTESADALKFLQEYTGLPFDHVIHLKNHQTGRTHVLPLNYEKKIIRNFLATNLTRKIEEMSKSDPERLVLMENTTVTSLIVDEKNAIVGVSTYSATGKSTIDCTAVVIATGGYGHYNGSDSYLQKYASEASKFPTLNFEADGNGLKLAEQVGAKILNMDKVQISPTACHRGKNNHKNRDKYMLPAGLLERGGVLLNANGTRFANELGSNDYLVKQMEESASLGNYICARLYMNKDPTNKYLGIDVAKKYAKNSISGLFKLKFHSKDVGIPFETLDKSFGEYNDSAANMKVDPFGKLVFPLTFNTTDFFYIWELTPAIYYSLGGIQIDERARVISKNGEPIRGLYAAGEVTTGIHGAEMLEGNALLDAVVFGRTAGYDAAGKKLTSKSAKTHPTLIFTIFAVFLAAIQHYP